MYLESFRLPIEIEEQLIQERMIYNGGKKYGYIDNIYPCRLFSKKQLTEVNFDRITIFYGGNGSGKSTLLNLIANKLELNRVAPFLLSLPGARIYDLDEAPVDIKNWWELENTKLYFEFFNKYRDLFE